MTVMIITNRTAIRISQRRFFLTNADFSELFLGADGTTGGVEASGSLKISTSSSERFIFFGSFYKNEIRVEFTLNYIDGRAFLIFLVPIDNLGNSDSNSVPSNV